MKAIEAGIITTTTRTRLSELETEAIRSKNAITLEESSITHVERDFIVYWMEQLQGGNIESVEFRCKVIDLFVNTVFLGDDHIRIAFNYSGKGSAVELALLMETETGAEGSYTPPGIPPQLRLRIERFRVFFFAFAAFRTDSISR